MFRLAGLFQQRRVCVPSEPGDLPGHPQTRSGDRVIRRRGPGTGRAEDKHVLVIKDDNIFMQDIEIKTISVKTC